MKKGFFIILLVVLSPVFIFSLGQTEEADYKQVSGKENWEYEVPLEGKEPGEYNLLIRAKDKANNEVFTVPYDIFIDPESDLPIVSITNPSSFMRVGGNLNIVGTARDDDDVKTVLLKINDGEFFEAVGAEFWSYSLSSDLFEDGQHVITAKAVDINGLEGRETVVIYNQDTLKPTNTIENHKNGVIFSGKVHINGKVVDANGIANLEVSRDNQESYSSVKFDQDEGFYTFELDIDTKKLEDGPNIYWFQSGDKTGSIANTAFLFFVDNIGPEITIIDPIDVDGLNGEISVSGIINDEIGIKTFKYIYGELEGDITLKDGNPYWTQKIDFISEKKDKTKITFISEDTSGNITELDYEVFLNKESDKPILTLSSPIEGKIYKESLIIEGSILDDDYIDGLSITLDGEEVEYVKTFNSFTKSTHGLTTGKHKLVISAKDSNDINGDEIEIPFEIDSFNPEITINSIIQNAVESKYYPGIIVTTDGGYQITGNVKSGNPITSLKYKIENGDFVELKFKKSTDGSAVIFNLGIDNNFTYGASNYTIKAVDSYNNETLLESFVYVQNYSAINQEWGFSYVDIPEKTDISLKPTKPFNMYFNGPEIKSVTTSPISDVVKVEFNGGIVSALSNEEGSIQDLKIIVETDKGFFETQMFNFIVDNSRPVLVLETPEIDSIQSAVLPISGIITDSFLNRLEYRYSSEADFKELKFSGTDGEYSFKTTLDIPVTTDESLSIEIKATDILGNSSIITRSFGINENKFVQTLLKEVIDANVGKSTDRPIIKVNFPTSNEVIFSEPFVSGFSRDDDGIKSIKISEIVEGGQSIVTSSTGLFDLSLLKFGTGKKTLNISSIDINGVESKPKKISYIYEPETSIIKLKDYKLGSLISSEPGVLIDGEILGDIKGTLSFAFNGDELKKISVTENQYSIPVGKNLTWGQNDLRISFIDVYGREYNLQSFFYIVDKVNVNNIKDNDGFYFTDNRIKSDYIDLSSENSLTGIFKGRNIQSIVLEAENGEIPTFLDVSNINNQILIKSSSNGVSEETRVVITTIDGDIYYSNYYKFINDDLKPELILDTKDNQFIKEKITLSGKVTDDIKVTKLMYSINSGITWQDIELKIPEIIIEDEVNVKDEKYTSTSLDLGNKNKPETEPELEPEIEIKEFIFSHDVDFSNRKDGGYSIWIKLVDINGNEVLRKISFIKDNTNPMLSLFIPGEDEVNGVVTLIGKSSDNIEMDTISYSKDEITYTQVGSMGVFSFDIDFGEDEVFPETFVVRAQDKSGNYTDVYPIFNINQEKDKPVVQIQTPTNGEVIRNDFIVSGMAFDDDGVASIFYSLDGGELLPVAQNENNFSVNISLDSIENNEHIITVKAVDILGVESDIITSSFWVSKEEPASTLLLPKIEDTKRDTIKLVGTSFDENGIDSVYISTDNGVSYQKAIGTNEWNYNFNTKNIKDGTYSLFVKAIDKLQTVGFYSTLINIDNTSPELIINQPVDGDILSDKIVFSGRSMDNIGLRDVLYKIYSHTISENESIVMAEGNLSNKGIFNIEIPLEGFEVGDYNIELIAYDEADNRSISTRNFTVTKSDNAGDLEMLFPQPGSVNTSQFEVSGKILGHKPVSFVECFIDNVLFTEIKVNEFNFFNLNINTLKLTEGEHTINLKATLNDGQIYDTPSYVFTVKNSGAWLNIINMHTGENISGRPFLTGEAGYIQSEDTPVEEVIIPTLVEVSLDNGQIFEPAKGTSSWQFRIETWLYDDGLTPILVRSTYSNGETKTNRIAVNFDRTDPTVSVLEDLENGSFNDSIKVSGIASDANGLTDISVILREGTKSNYEIPGLFQGMFIDVETGFGKLYGGGIGLTFFDDNVKIQFTIGQTRTASVDARIKGLYYGGKLLANIYTLEYGQIFGPDMDNISSSIGFGASFTNKTLSVSNEDSVMWYSAFVSQLEVVKIKFDSDYISSLAIFLDFEATLISSENTGGFFPKLGLGTRITLF